MDYSKGEIYRLNQQIFNGFYTVNDLPISLYASIGIHLTKAIQSGAGINYNTYEWGNIGADMAYQLRENIYLFSGAKTFQYVLSTKNLIVNEAGQIIDFKEFQRLAEENFNLYNKTWLATEWETAQISAGNIVSDINFKENGHLFPFLKYNTQEDGNVSEICLQFANIVKRFDDEFWIENSPQNHYKCRCFKTPQETGAVTNTDNRSFLKPKGIFAQNPAITGKIFTKEHPYFDVPHGFKGFAKTNFGLPLPEIPKSLRHEKK